MVQELYATNPDNSYQCADLPGIRWARSQAELDLAVEQLCAAAKKAAEKGGGADFPKDNPQ
jgi:hypothetical protein